MYDSEFEVYAKTLQIDGFRGMTMRDELPKKPLEKECGILNKQTFKLLRIC